MPNKTNNEYTAEIYVMGILMEYQNKGIGKALLKIAEEDLKKDSYKFLIKLVLILFKKSMKYGERETHA